MKICVKMSEAEMLEFLQFRKNKQKANAERDSLRMIAQAVLWAIVPDPEKKGKYMIADNDHAEDLLEMAGVYAD